MESIMKAIMEQQWAYKLQVYNVQDCPCFYIKLVIFSPLVYFILTTNLNVISLFVLDPRRPVVSFWC